MGLRQLALDTETTGLSPDRGHKLVEIGLVELIDRQLTGRTLQLYFDPRREVPEEAQQVHGLSRDDLVELSGGKTFAECAPQLLDFIGDAELIIQNAGFDLGFLDAEFQAAGFEPLSGRVRVYDTLSAANKRYPGQRNNLDALARRHDVVHRGRELHGALLDAEILADVYLAMTQEQSRLNFSGAEPARPEMATPAMPEIPARTVSASVASKMVRVPVDEHASQAHQAFLDRLQEQSGEAVAWPKEARQYDPGF